MIQLKISTKTDLLKAINPISIKKIYAKEISTQQDLTSFTNEIKSSINATGSLTLIAIKE